MFSFFCPGFNQGGSHETPSEDVRQGLLPGGWTWPSAGPRQWVAYLFLDQPLQRPRRPERPFVSGIFNLADFPSAIAVSSRFEVIYPDEFIINRLEAHSGRSLSRSATM